MSAQNLSARRGGLIAGVSALALLVLVGAFDNQWDANWRDTHANTGNTWLSGPVSDLDKLAWRATKASGEPTRFYIGNLTAVLLAVVLTGLLIWLFCRGVSAERGRWTMFFGAVFATGLGAGLGLAIGIAIADTPDAPLGNGHTYYDQFTAGMTFMLTGGWLIGLVAVIMYGLTGGMADLGATSEYTSPSGYDYGAATPSSNYSFSPTSPYGGYSGGSGGSAATDPTQVVPPQGTDPYGGGSSY